VQTGQNVRSAGEGTDILSAFRPSALPTLLQSSQVAKPRATRETLAAPSDSNRTAEVSNVTLSSHGTAPHLMPAGSRYSRAQLSTPTLDGQYLHTAICAHQNARKWPITRVMDERIDGQNPLPSQFPITRL
jgi:hypothetical protein